MQGLVEGIEILKQITMTRQVPVRSLRHPGGETLEGGGANRTKVTCGGEGCGHPVSYKGNEIETAERRGKKENNVLKRISNSITDHGRPSTMMYDVCGGGQFHGCQCGDCLRVCRYTRGGRDAG